MQTVEKVWGDDNLIKVLKGGGVAIMPTDTIYGIVGRAENKVTVDRIYKIRERPLGKPCIILIGNISELEKFSVILPEDRRNKIENFWSLDSDQDQPSAVSVVLDCTDESFSYLHRGTKTLAFRVPASQLLRNLLMNVGPLIAPSANKEGLPPSRNILEAKKYFGDSVDLYTASDVDEGQLEGSASKVLRLHPDGSVAVLRV